MSHFRPISEKTADDGSHLVISIDGHHAWFLQRPADREAQANPLGAFQSQQAARTWADREFPGGEWAGIDRLG